MIGRDEVMAQGLTEVPTKVLWEKIEMQALLGQRHLKWDLYLARIKALVDMIEDRMKWAEIESVEGDAHGKH